MHESTIRLLGQLQEACARSPEPLTFIHNGLSQTVVVRVEDAPTQGRIRVRLDKPEVASRLRSAIAWVKREEERSTLSKVIDEWSIAFGGCDAPRWWHKYDERGVCKHCGHERQGDGHG